VIFLIGKIKSLIKKDSLAIKLPRHIAITMHGMEKWSLKNNLPYQDAFKKGFLAMKNTIASQVKLKIPILSFYILEEDYDKDTESYGCFLDSISEMLDDLANSSLVNENKIKITVLGKWYNLPGRLVEAIKNTIEGTGDYDGFFVNLCVNYDGQEEIVDAVKILGMQIKSGKLDPELIDKDSIKENIYSSYFLPPDLMVKNGSRNETSGFLLWDSVNTKIYFTNKLWPDFDRTEFTDAIKEFQKGG
jgi:undecaprenyl diphosphate synthase